MTLDEEIESWRPVIEQLLGKEKWDSLTCFQQMCEIAAVKEANKRGILGFNLFQTGYE